MNIRLCKHCNLEFDIKQISNHSRWCKFNPKRKSYLDKLQETRLKATPGTKSAANMDLLLRTAGEKYINSIPAMGDGYLSFGLYQFTSYAAGRDASGPRPANMVSDLSDYKIPDSVVKFDSVDQHRAALYFSIYNLAYLSKKLSPQQQAKFNSYCSNNKLSITQFIATAHHQPATAVRGAKKWIDDKCKNNYKYYQNEALSIYAAKTETNYKAIESL